MKIVIPMAGYGTRLRPHTYSRPKPLVNVAGQPMLKFLIDSLLELEADEFIFIVGHLGDQIKTWVNETYPFAATFVTQDELIGQAHAIYLAREHLDGPCVVLFADTIFQTDLSIIHTTTADGIAFTKVVDDPRRFGVAELDSTGRVTGFVEKPDSMENRNAVIGFYYIRDSRAMIEAIETQMARKRMTKGEFYLTDAYQIMVDNGAEFRTQPVDIWLDCGKPETVLETNRWLLENGHDNSDSIQRDTVTVISPSYVHPDTVLERAIVGPYATVNAGCTVRDSVVKNSILDEGALVERIIMDDSLIGQGARVMGRHFTLNVGDSSSLDFT